LLRDFLRAAAMSLDSLVALSLSRLVAVVGATAIDLRDRRVGGGAASPCDAIVQTID